MPTTLKDVRGGSHREGVVFILRRPATPEEEGHGQTQEVPTEEERREALRQSQHKYYKTHREAINERRAKAYKRKRAAIKAGQKEA